MFVGNMWSFLALTLPLLPLIFAQPVQVYLLSTSSAPHSRDFLHQLQQLVIGIFQLVRPTDYGLALTPARSKKHKKPPKYPNYNKQIFDRLGFGNLSFNLGFMFNFQLSNSVGFNRQLAGVALAPQSALRVN
ncbi:hypothetical protein ACLKA7_017553 [Drosophila subpalustris]